ncbi:hypothetical protein TWF506_001440 [Arthrobotrys conoides]|uniref:Uncharacterized protein n=1 Tax=Arthrobotrys conoides TaxID=74498 RepID=A0AAN8NNH9_9PEZI
MPSQQTTYTLLTLLLTPLLLHPTPTTAYYQLGSRSKRPEWFGSFESYSSGSRIGDNKVNKCTIYTNLNDRGFITAVTIYNQPRLRTSASVFAFYGNTVCGRSGSTAERKSTGRGKPPAIEEPLTTPARGRPPNKGKSLVTETSTINTRKKGTVVEENTTIARKKRKSVVLKDPAELPIIPPLYIAVLDKPFTDEAGETEIYNPEDADGVWLINLFQALGRAPTFKSMKALDYTKEIKPGGLLEGTEGDPAQVIYKWDKNGHREPEYVTGAVVKLGEPGGVIEKLTTSADMYMALRDLTERGLRPGSENIPNPLPRYFADVVAGKVAGGLTSEYLGDAIDSQTGIREKKVEMRNRGKNNRNANPQGLRNLMSLIEKEQEGGMSDTSAQLELDNFLEQLSLDEREQQIEESRDEPDLQIEESRDNPEPPAAREQSNTMQQAPITIEEEFDGDLYMDVIGANIPAEAQFLEVENGGSETPDSQRLVKASDPVDDLTSQESRNSARALAFQKFMEKATSMRSNPDQQGTQNMPPIKTEWELGDPVTPVKVRIRPDGVNLIQSPEDQQIPITRPSQRIQAGPEDAIVISSDGSVAEEPQAGDMEIEGEIIQLQDVQAEQIPVASEERVQEQGQIQEQVPEQVQEQIQLQEQNPLPQVPNINQEVEPEEEEIEIQRIAAVDALQDEVPLQQSQPQLQLQPEGFLAGFLSPPSRTWESRESSRNMRDLANFQPEFFIRRSSTSTGRRPVSRQSEQSLPPASFDDIENPRPATVPNSNDRVALNDLLEREDQLPGDAGSFERYEAFVPGRRRPSGNQST